MSLVGNGPLDLLALGEIHGLSDGGREIDVPLFGSFALDELNFSRSAHKSFLVSSHLTRHKRKKKIILFVIFSSQSQTPATWLKPGVTERTL